MADNRKRGLRRRGNVWWIRYYRDGKRYEESAHSSSELKARKLLKLREGDVQRGVPVTPKFDRLRFDDAAGDFLNDYKINGKKSYDHVERRLKLHLTPYFGGRRMVSIVTPEIRAFVDQRQQEGAANASINRELAILKRMFVLATQAGKLLHRPYIPMLQENNARAGFFERDQFESVRDHLPPALRPLVTFAYYTGWRIMSEVLSLQWRQVDLKAGICRLEPGTTKNREGREFDFSGLEPLDRLLKQLWAEHEALEKTRHLICPWVFHRNGKQIRSFHRAWQSACEAAGCPGRIPHDLRRTAVRNLVRAGVPERVAMKLTGHKTRSVFDRYDITAPEDLKEAGRRLSQSVALAR